MSGFDYEAADARQQAALRDGAMPSPLDTYDRNHSLTCVDIAALDAWAKGFV